MNQNSLANLKKERVIKVCVFCEKKFDCAVVKRHEKSCKLNPINQKECPVCKTKFSKSGKTCSYSCSNTFFRSGKNNPNWKESRYQTTCFEYHGKKCLVCGETKIVAAHHVNKNHSDSRPENLVPLCPTHHQYVHSRYAEEVQPIIDKYLIEKFNM
jgi:hypothetical protein